MSQTEKSTTLTKYEPVQLVAPADSDAVLTALKRFEDFKEKSIDKDDYMTIGTQRFIRKSGLLKYALACALSLQQIEERRVQDEKTGVFTYHFVYRAFHPGTGRFADAVGSCSSNEKMFKTEHLCRSMAQTRACNRAISNLVASGQVSAEEVVDDDTHSGFQPRNEGEALALERARNMGKPNPLLKDPQK